MSSFPRQCLDGLHLLYSDCLWLFSVPVSVMALKRTCNHYLITLVTTGIRSIPWDHPLIVCVSIWMPRMKYCCSGCHQTPFLASRLMFLAHPWGNPLICTLIFRELISSQCWMKLMGKRDPKVPGPRCSLCCFSACVLVCQNCSF